MTVRPTPSTGLLALVLSALVGLALPVIGAAPAAADARPVADTSEVYAGGTYRLPVLDNDGVSGVFPGELSLCGVAVDDSRQQVLYAEIDRTDPTQIYVEVSPRAPDIVTFTYDACERSSRATTTVTLVVTRLVAPVVRKKPKRRGQLTAVNRNDAPLEILWGSNRVNITDGRRVIRPGRTITIRVKRTRIYWVAFVRDQGAIVVAGDGTVTKIKKAKKRRGR